MFFFTTEEQQNEDQEVDSFLQGLRIYHGGNVDDMGAHRQPHFLFVGLLSEFPDRLVQQEGYFIFYIVLFCYALKSLKLESAAAADVVIL